MTEYSGINKHKRYKKKLITPMKQFPMEEISWRRDLIPEFLWIEFLRQAYSEKAFLNLHLALTSQLGSYVSGTLAFLGLVSDFGRVPKNKRLQILRKHKDLVMRAFIEPFGDILKMYPESPAYWLLPDDWLKTLKINRDKSITRLKKTLERLYPGKDSYCGYLRMIPLRQLFKEGKIIITRDMEVTNLLPKYPHGLNDEDRTLCETFGRALLNPIISNYTNEWEWSKYFWRRNFELSPCERRSFMPSSRESEKQEFFKKIRSICLINREVLSKYLKNVTETHTFDLYTPERDEIALGLFARLIRLSSSILENPFLWSYDLSRIILRCLSDTVITFCYLIKKDDDDLYRSFLEYGVGKEKLLLLHLQDTHPNKVAPSGETTKQLAQELGGGFSPELININLGDWKDVSARDMAEECDLLDIYRIIYDPTSSDIHGTWVSIKNVNLTYCINPLHRYHRIPQIEDPPLFLQPLKLSINLVQKAIQFAQQYLDFPGMDKQLLDLPSPSFS